MRDTYKTTVMPLKEGETRDCFSPWTFMQIKVDGAYCPCCDHAAIGNVNKQGLAELMEGQEIRKLRQSLIDGKLDKWCRNCQAKPTISIASFRENLKQFLGNNTARSPENTEAIE